MQSSYIVKKRDCCAIRWHNCATSKWVKNLATTKGYCQTQAFKEALGEPFAKALPNQEQEQEQEQEIQNICF